MTPGMEAEIREEAEALSACFEAALEITRNHELEKDIVPDIALAIFRNLSHVMLGG